MGEEQHAKSINGSPGESVQPVPDGAIASMADEIQEAGGEWTGNPEDEGAVGWTAFDNPSSDDGTITVLLPKDTILDLPHQSLVRVKSRGDGRAYLGVVVKGPFAEPDGLRSDAPVVVTATVRGRGNILISNYHGRIQLELLGEELEDGSTVPPRRRPLPNSPVFALSPEETAKVLRTTGDIALGVAESHDEIEVKIPIMKSVLPRHLGVLGTTGGGKSTTVSGIVNQLQNAGVACILLDTEGEYTAINEPTADSQMLRALKRRGLAAQGVADTHVYHLVGKNTANPDHPDSRAFSLRFSELSPYTVMEILDLSEAQQDRFLKSYDITKLALERLGIYPSSDKDRTEVMELDEQETGYPSMSLSHVYDVIRLTAAKVGKEAEDPYLDAREFYNSKDTVKQLIDQSSVPGDVRSWRRLQGKLGRIKRLRIFDNPDALPLDYVAMLKPGRVSIIDLSDTDSPQVNNLVIAQLLRGVQRRQDEVYRDASEKEQKPLQTMVLIEEAHEFLSRERIKHMQVLFEQVARIARRGRKRWLGLGFITQLPQQLPDEVLGLVNNWVFHKISDANVVNRLRHSIGGIDDGLWARLPALAPGQAVVSFTSMARPLLVAELLS